MAWFLSSLSARRSFKEYGRHSAVSALMFVSFTRAFQPWVTVGLQEHPYCLFDHVLVRDGYAFASHHPGPQRELVEETHELVSRQHGIAAIEDSEGGQVVEITREPLR